MTYRVRLPGGLPILYVDLFLRALNSVLNIGAYLEAAPGADGVVLVIP